MQPKSVAASHTAGRPALAYCLDTGVGWRAAIGLLVLATDQTIEYEWRRLLNLEGVAFFGNRIANMTLHMIPGIWLDDWGIELSECFRVTEAGAEPFTAFPRQLFVKE